MKSKSLQLGIAMAAAGLCLQPQAAPAAQGDWLVRAGVGLVTPKSDNLTITGLGEVQVDDGTSLTIEAAYFLTDNWSVELLAAYPFSHDVDLDGAEGTAKIGEVEHLPPTVSVQYHFLPAGAFRPYVGLGLNYTTFFSEKTTGPIAGTDLSLDDSWGLAAQIGADYTISDNWFVNGVIRWIDIDSDATLDGGDLGEVEIDPYVFQLQAGYRFGKGN